jgi:membrane-associated phospholipid phosphatase
MLQKVSLTSRTILITAAVGLVACGPDATPVAPSAESAVLLHSGGTRTSTLASPAWQTLAGQLVAQASFNPLVSGHAYPLLGVAQYRAVLRTEMREDDGDDDDRDRAENNRGGHGRRAATDRGAVAGASVVVLRSLFPARTAEIDALLAAQASGGSDAENAAFAAGEVVGRVVGAEVLARASSDGFNTPANPLPPIGPGFWISNTSPSTVAGGQLPAAKPWFLRASNQFRPPPPPAFGSAAFTAALAEIRLISDTRTPEQIRIAGDRALNAGTVTPSGYILSVATDKLAQSGEKSERKATHIYALASATMYDAAIGCWDAKLTYWTIRPWQVDPGIVVLPSVSKPNHPSYPSGHSCVTSAGATILTAFFPRDRASLAALVTESGLSRMYGGIHYRFDVDAGQTLGRRVAALALLEDYLGRSVLTARW